MTEAQPQQPEEQLPDCLCKAADGQAVSLGSLVVCVDELFRNHWFFEWPGRVVGKKGSKAIVEFLGWGEPKTRRKRLRGKRLSLIDNLSLLARLHKIASRIQLPEGRKRRWKDAKR